tara:strand:- start:37 stop:222 length:186 start_codon:yes stop_codon:yes gene_type:complete
MAVEITKSDFLEYKKVQESGEFNVFDPQARAKTSLSREQWVAIMRDYKSFNNAWGKESEEN